MPRRPLPSVLLPFTVVALVLAVRALPARSAPLWHAHVDRWVLDTLDDDGEAEFLVFLEAQAELSAASAMAGNNAAAVSSLTLPWKSRATVDQSGYA